MSKTITIPTNHNPYIVVINNHMYVYKAGETIEVPDEVAETIEDAIELEPKPKRYLSRIAQLAEGSINEITEDDLMGIEKIAPGAFYNRDSITSITIPSGVKRIELSAFGFCDGLIRVTVPDSIESIGSKAFESCTMLTMVIVKALTPPTIEEDTFVYVPTTCVFEVPAEAVEAYKAAQYWSAFANRIVAIEE